MAVMIELVSTVHHQVEVVQQILEHIVIIIHGTIHRVCIVELWLQEGVVPQDAI